MARFASALSQHPLAATAVGEVIGHLSDQLDDLPDVLVMFISGSYLENVESIAETIREVLAPRCFIGCSAVGVVGGSQEIEQDRGLAVWAGCIPGAQTFRVEPGDHGVIGFESTISALAPGSTAVLLADPFSVPVESLLSQLDQFNIDNESLVSIVGGLASAGRSPGQNVLIVDDEIVNDGAVGVIFGPRVASPLVSQGCRPIGSPWTVTKANGQLVQELAGEPAMGRLDVMLEGLSEDERRLVARGLHVGIVANENADAFTQGDFLIRAVLGADRATGSIAVGAAVEIGQVLQFQVRDEQSASAELQSLLQEVEGRGALVFTCNGRGSHLFTEANHDATAVYERVGSAVSGMFCAGEIGPVGAQQALHGFTATVLVFA